VGYAALLIDMMGDWLPAGDGLYQIEMIGNTLDAHKCSAPYCQSCSSLRRAGLS
jgi:hypothetical protein